MLVRLDAVTKRAVQEAVVDAWLAVAPKKTVEANYDTVAPIGGLTKRR